MKANYKLADYGKTELESGQEGELWREPFELGLGCIVFGLPLVILGGGAYFKSKIGSDLQFSTDLSFTGWVEKAIGLGNGKNGVLNYFADGTICTGAAVFTIGDVSGHVYRKYKGG